MSSTSSLRGGISHRSLAGVALTLVLAACSPPIQTAVPSRPSSSASAAATSTPAVTGKVPVPSTSSGPFIVDLTWVSDLTGWALSAVKCGVALCTELTSTTDGGRTWHALPSPPAKIQNGTVDCSKVACVTHVRFATATLGYLYGPAFLVTSDGGQSWRPQASTPVEALEPTQVGVYRIVYAHGGCPGPCSRTVEVAQPGSSSWRTLVTIPHLNVPSHQDTAQLVPQGSQDIYIPIYGDLAAGAGTQQAVVMRSLDAGRTWHQVDDPCVSAAPGINVAIGFAASAGGFAAAFCVPRVGGAGGFVVTSNSAGTMWGPPHRVPDSSIQLLAAASPTHLALATAPSGGSGPITYTLYVSTDSGAHWVLTVSDAEVLDSAAPGSAFLGFEDSSVGRWVGYEGAIWTTDDGGVHWVRRPFH
jgi:hypothetical protein